MLPEARSVERPTAAAAFTGGKDSVATSSLTTPVNSGTTSSSRGASIDSTVGRTEYTFASGFNRGALRIATVDRVRPINGRIVFSPGARVEWGWKRLSLAAAFDRTADASVYALTIDTTTHTDTAGKRVAHVDTLRKGSTPQTTHTDAFARLTPFSWLELGASWSRVAPQDTFNIPPTVTTRLEAAVKWRERWFSVGSIARGVTTVAPIVELDTALRRVLDNKVTGITAGFHGPLWFGWGLDVQGVHWATASAYRPQSELRTTLKFSSGFLGRFPRNNFHLLVAGTHEYRGSYFVPTDSTFLTKPQSGYSVIGGLLEVRIGEATITYQVRNPVGVVYASYPGYVMPRIVNLYGVRWAFWN